MIDKIILILGLCIFSLLGYSCVGLNKKENARRLAEEYLQQKYTQEMIFLKTTHTWVEPANYNVYFYPKNNTEIIFRVVYPNNLLVPEERKYIIRDNYFIKLFSFNFGKLFLPLIQEIWSENISIVDNLHHKYEFLKEGMSFEEIEPYLNYGIHISSDKIISKIEKHKEAVKMLETFNIIKSNRLTPNRITFSYKIDKRENAFFIFTNWAEIYDINKIIETIENELRKGEENEI